MDVVRENSHVTKLLFRHFLFRLSNVLDIHVNIGISGLKYTADPIKCAFIWWPRPYRQFNTQLKLFMSSMPIKILCYASTVCKVMRMTPLFCSIHPNAKILFHYQTMKHDYSRFKSFPTVSYFPIHCFFFFHIKSLAIKILSWSHFLSEYEIVFSFDFVYIHLFFYS